MDEHTEEMVRKCLAMPRPEVIPAAVVASIMRYKKLYANVGGGPISPAMIAMLVQYSDRRRGRDERKVKNGRVNAQS